MKKFPVVIDLETKYTFRDFSEHAKLGITVLGLFDYENKSQKIFTEKDLNDLFDAHRNEMVCPSCGKKDFTAVRAFNLLVKTLLFILLAELSFLL